MIISVVAGLALLRDSSFPAQPDETQMKVGAATAKRKPNLSLATLTTSQDPRLGVESIYLGDRKDIGWWSNGYIKHATEYCLRLTPALMSRWVGFLQYREKLSPAQVQERWDQIQSELGNRGAVIVRLSAFPKQGMMGDGEEERANLADLNEVRFVVLVDGEQVEVGAHRLGSWEAKDRRTLEQFKWWLETPLAGVLSPEFEPGWNQRPVPLGGYHATWWLVSLPAGLSERQALSVHVLSKRKERVATWKSAK